MRVMHCASCGFEIDDQFKFCTSCGAVLQRRDDAMTTADEGKQAPIGDGVPPEVVGEQAQMTDKTSTEAEAVQARPIASADIEPLFTFKYGRAGNPREIRLYEKHVTWHELAYNQVNVIPYRSIHYLDCAELKDGEHVVFMRIADPNINFAISGSAADMAAVVERLTHLIA